MSNNTIYALSSGAPPAGVAIIRVSGPGVNEIIKGLCGHIIEPRFAHLCNLKHPQSGILLDRALVLFFKGPHSFTGEDVVEFHLHGGRAVIEAVLAALLTFDNVQMAEAGEFSRRAFENGQLDLVEIEGLSDLIVAETEAQRVQALSQAGGAVSALYEGWRTELIQAIALVESALDFSDEGDVPDDVFLPAIDIVSGLAEKIKHHLDDKHRGEILRHGFRVVIAGPPNAGKSSLMNKLARRDVAIVSDEEGTTRDVISVHLDLEGVPVIVSDTAGIRAADSKVEQEGIRRSIEQASFGELVIWLCDATVGGESREEQDGLPREIRDLNVPVLQVWNKIDSYEKSLQFSELDHYQDSQRWERFGHGISALTGEGLDQLIGEIGKRAIERLGTGDEPRVTRHRHRELLQLAVDALGEFMIGDKADIEIRAEDLRRAANALGRITGKLDVEEVLDFIFAEFCIGK